MSDRDPLLRRAAFGSGSAVDVMECPNVDAPSFGWTPLTRLARARRSRFSRTGDPPTNKVPNTKLVREFAM